MCARDKKIEIFETQYIICEVIIKNVWLRGGAGEKINKSTPYNKKVISRK